MTPIEQVARQVASLKVRIVRHEAAASTLRYYANASGTLTGETIDDILTKAGL